MANNPKWTIPFASLGGNSCRADVFDMDAEYTGTATELTGATQPVTIDEEDDDDLLTVIRPRTGYLNIVETDDTSAAIEALKPATNTSRKVVIYSGTDVIFQGFLQAQTFQNAWVPNPRQLSMPILSPLALLDDVDMPVYDPPRREMLCKLLSDAIGKLNDKGAGIIQVLWPQESKLLSEEVNTIAVCDYNDAHDTTQYSDEPLMKADTTRYLIEGICNCFGWMVHDEPGKLIFTKFDHQTQGAANYLTTSPTDLATYANVTTCTFTGLTLLTLTDYMTPADASGEESILMPYEKVRLNYDGDVVKSAEFDFSHLKYYNETQDQNGGQQIAFFESETPELTGYSPDGWLLKTNEFSSANNMLRYEGVMACVCGNARLLYRKKYPTSATGPDPTAISYDDYLFTMAFYDRPTASEFKLRMDKTWGSFIADFGNSNWQPHPDVGVRIRVGNLYYHGNGVWNTTRPVGSVYNFSTISNCPVGPVIVEFYDASDSTIPSGTTWKIYLSIEDIRLETVDAVFSEYKIKNKGYTELKLSDGCGQETADIYAGFNAYYRNSHLLGSALITNPSLWFTRYTYMLYSREQLKLRMRRTTLGIPYYMKCAAIAFAGQTWRLISLAHDVWNDECTVQLQRSLQPNEE